MGGAFSGTDIKYKVEPGAKPDVVRIFVNEKQIIACLEDSDFYKFMKHIQSIRNISDFSRSIDNNAMREMTREDFIVEMGIGQSSDDDDSKASDDEINDERLESIVVNEPGDGIVSQRTFTIHSRKEVLRLDEWENESYGLVNTQQKWFLVEDDSYYDFFRLLLDKELHSTMGKSNLAQKGENAHAPEMDDVVHNLLLLVECHSSVSKGMLLKDDFEEIVKKLCNSVHKLRSDTIEKFVTK